MVLALQGSVDDAGKMVAWSHESYSDTYGMRPRAGDGGAGPARLLATRYLENGIEPYYPSPTMGRHAGIHRNLDPLYEFPNKRLVKNLVRDLPLRTSALRTLGAYANVFAIESFMDELAEAAGIHDRIAAITARSMAGKIDFAGALHERVGLLAGLSVSTLDRVAARITFNPGARTLIRTLRAGGAYTALVTGGFTCFAETVARDCGFDEMRGNTLLIDGDRLSGEVGEPILGPESKLAILRELAGRHGLNMAATAAVGDGANDLAMVQAAGLGAAYRGKPVLRQAAGFRLDHGDLTGLLYLQGYRQEDFTK